MIKRTIQIEGQGLVEIYAVKDDDPNIEFQPCAFLCKFCTKLSWAKVSLDNELECLSCGKETRRADGRWKQTIYWIYALASVLPIVLISDLPDSVMVPAFFGSFGITILAFTILMWRKQTIYKYCFSSICITRNIGHRGLLMLLMLPTWFYTAYAIMGIIGTTGAVIKVITRK